MKLISHLVLACTAFGCFTCGIERTALAQYPVILTPAPTVPVIGYRPERRGLFGQRTVYRPVVVGAAPVAPAVPVSTIVQSPVVPSVAVPSVAVPSVAIQPATTLARPILPPPPTEVRYSPVVAAPTTVYYPPAPVLTVPTIRTYRVPVVFAF